MSAPPRRPGWDPRRSVTACCAWGARVVEPLLSADQICRLEQGLAEATAADPVIVATWAAGITASVCETLSPDDMWRAVMLPPSGPPLWPDGRAFAGSPADGEDLVPAVGPDLDLDVGLLPLEDGLSPRAARVLIAALLEGWRRARSEALELVELEEASQAASDLSAVIRTALWRRRAYGPVGSEEDAWSYDLAWRWAERAYAILETGVEPTDEELEADVRHQRIIDPDDLETGL